MLERCWGIAQPIEHTQELIHAHATHREGGVLPRLLIHLAKTRSSGPCKRSVGCPPCFPWFPAYMAGDRHPFWYPGWPESWRKTCWGHPGQKRLAVHHSGACLRSEPSSGWSPKAPPIHRPILLVEYGPGRGWVYGPTPILGAPLICAGGRRLASLSWLWHHCRPTHGYRHHPRWPSPDSPGTATWRGHPHSSICRESLQ